MAVVDVERGAVVIRIVYDGPPHAGKTTSVRALAQSLTRAVTTPAEVAGRTTFFDWLEYTGGLFEGHQIRCQIVSVPGQPRLAARRRALVETADAVVFVADASDRQAVARSARHIRELGKILAARDELPVGIVVQANKRDLPGALTRDEVRDAFGPDFERTAVTESIAEAGSGIRETFVFAVRLALDRVRELFVQQKLPQGRPGVDTADELLAQLEHLPLGSVYAPDELSPEDAEADAAAAVAVDPTARPIAVAPPVAPLVPEPPPVVIAPVMVEPEPPPLRESMVEPAALPPPPTIPPPPRPLPNGPPRLPDTRVASGAIWPPVEGRMVLHEATSVVGAPYRLPSGDWVAGLGSPWRIYSAAGDVYADVDAGRSALLAWAREHAGHSELLSPSRCVALAEAAPGTWRLWQVVRMAPSLRNWLVEGAGLEPPALYARLAQAAASLGEAHERFEGTRLAPALDAVGRTKEGIHFVAMMPSVGTARPRAPSDVDGAIARELVGALAGPLAECHAELVDAVVSSRRRTSRWEMIVAIAVADAPS